MTQIIPYAGSSGFDTSSFYCPYIPLTTSGVMMTWAGCYGVRICGQDKLAYTGIDAQPSILGMKIIGELQHTIKQAGYDVAINRLIKESCNLFMTDGMRDPLTPASLLHLLSAGRGYEKPGFIFDRWCKWCYIVNMDSETFEIYQGDQTSPHERGRYADMRAHQHPESDLSNLPGFVHLGQSSYRRLEAMKDLRNSYPVALLYEFPLKEIINFNPRDYFTEIQQ